MSRLVFFNNTATVDNASSTYSTPKAVPSEQIAIMDAAGNNLDLTGANATTQMRVVQGNDDGPAVLSPIFKKSDIKAVNTVVYLAPAAQITTVGFDGTSGDIAVTAGEDYRVKIVRLLDDEKTGSEPFPRISASYTAKTGDTPFTIADKIAGLFNANDRAKVNVEALSQETSSQIQDDDGTPANVTFAVTKGSATIVGTVTAAASIAGVVAGSYIRLGHATDDAYPVYKVKSVGTASGTTQEVVLERPYSGATATGVAGGVLAGAPLAGDAAGIKITAEDTGVSFATALSEAFADTSPVAAQTPDPGSGTYAQALEDEKNAQGSQGFLYRHTPFQGEKPEFFADSSLTYDIVVIRVNDDITDNIVRDSNIEMRLYFKQGELAGASADLATFFGV